MKLAVNTWSYNKQIKAGNLTQFDCIAKTKELGFNAIEFVGIIPHDGSTEVEYAKKLKAECDKVGLVISGYTIKADFLYYCPDDDMEKEIERVCEQVDIAEILGAKVMRHDATFGARGITFDSVLDKLAYACRKVTVYAESKGIKTMVENHGYFCQESVTVEKLVNAVNHKNFGLLCDMGNFFCVDEDPSLAFGRVAEYAFSVHAKDVIIKDGSGANPGEGFSRTRAMNYIRSTIVGHGCVPIIKCLSALKDVNYDGYIAVEYEGMEDYMTGLRISRENLERYLTLI